MNKIKLTLLATMMGTCLSGYALDYTFSGNFTKDNDITSFHFTVGSDSSVTIFSSSWVEGGFDPILAIWGTSGNKLYEQDDGHNIGTTPVNGVDFGHGDWDSYYTLNLSAGTYIATVGEYNNFANGSSLSDGFRWDSDEHFTYTQGFGSQPDFNGLEGDSRTSFYRFHILNVQEAIHTPQGVPDGASSITLLSLALASMAPMWRKRS